MSDDEFDVLEFSENDLAAIDHLMTKHSSIIQAEKVLHNVFGYSEFRLLQLQVVEQLLVQKKSALVLFPTGGGKSLCFQVPALCMPGLTIVVSPLISLMKDQVDTLRQKGVAAAQLDSTLTWEESNQVKDSIRNGSLKILYVAPERLSNEGFHELIADVHVSCVAVDESHCVSEWGASFRPEYLKVARFVKEIKADIVLCLTATATPEVAKDICEEFDIDYNSGVFKTAVFRPNLNLKVLQANSLDDKIAQIVPILRSRTGPAIIYVSLQRNCQEVADLLNSAGIPGARCYHGGLTVDQKKAEQELFMQGRDLIVVATIAFGMGVDKSNIRIVAHFNFCQSLESYSQEVGRAGRDGFPSDCYLFLHNPDLAVMEGFARGDTPSRRSVHSWLTEMCALGDNPCDPGVISISGYRQSADHDLRPTQLGIMNAQLELDYKYIRSLTPGYLEYAIQATSSQGWAEVIADRSHEAILIRKRWKVGKVWHTIDINSTARQGDVSRSVIQKRINRWEINGWVRCKVAQVCNRFAIVKPLPSDREEIEMLADKIYDLAVRREEKDLARIHKVVEMAVGKSCIPQFLSKHFGDAIGPCGNCTPCTTGRATNFPRPLFSTNIAPPSAAKIKAVLDHNPVRDDPRFLAKYAFGITSPRVRELKLSKHPTFGSLDDCLFEDILKAFTIQCDACFSTPYLRRKPSVVSSSQLKFGSKSGSELGKIKTETKAGAKHSGKPYARS
ncbi:atp-dependent dna helicase [Phaffia rhodozyma]|uniref:DNA 3'-5' helicase n=1 Tax=Phaffia rhodozyma TaxID=264483 RepID=A0A0F7SKF1_PHARH|nr:atp-dependent dna helicase [Phaffia rhodozyma]